MTYHNKEKQEVLQELNVQEATGLSSSEVKKRREQYGENRLRAKKSKSNWERFAEQFKDVMILILLAAAAISFVVACVEGDPEGFFEGKPCRESTRSIKKYVGTTCTCSS